MIGALFLFILAKKCLKKAAKMLLLLVSIVEKKLTRNVLRYSMQSVAL